MPLYLLVRVDGERVALPAAPISSVVELETVTPVPRVAAHVAGLAALRSRLVTVIDVRAALGLPARPLQLPIPAAIVAVDGHCYGLIVEAVEDVSEAAPPQPLCAAPGRWTNAACGLIEIDGALVLLLDPALIVTPPIARAA